MRRTFKDRTSAGGSPDYRQEPAPPAVDASETSSGEIENNRTPQRKPAQRAQVSESIKSLGAITVVQVRRIVAGLEAGHSERKIAQAEGLDEAAIRRVRAAELDRRNRQMGAVGVAFSGFLENVRTLHSDIDEAVLDELREVA